MKSAAGKQRGGAGAAGSGSGRGLRRAELPEPDFAGLPLPETAATGGLTGQAERARAGCAFWGSVYQAEIRAQADILPASPGGAPEDLDLYQRQKALDNARHAVSPGGILTGACDGGLGEPVFAEWMTASAFPALKIRASGNGTRIF